MQKLIIVRGTPGSGKSTYSKKWVDQGYEHFESDMYFMKDGIYQFDRKALPAAHEWCYREVETALYSGNNVVVSNTFTRGWEMEDYFTITEKQFWDCTVVECFGPFENVHNVPAETLSHMRARFVRNKDLQPWKHAKYYTFNYVDDILIPIIHDANVIVA